MNYVANIMIPKSKLLQCTKDVNIIIIKCLGVGYPERAQEQRLESKNDKTIFPVN